ncbi:MAG: hypothetical protein HY738_10800 [Bacteroidia bacterium]|nr:hypothetical protein [Bacteroidia bacterium]
MTILLAPAPPTVASDVICEGDNFPPFTATGTNIIWYTDALLSDTAAIGSTFTPLDSIPGTYDWFVTQTDAINGCASFPDTAILVINAIPAAPVASDEQACFGDSIPALVALGTNINWYSDSSLSVLEFSGAIFNTGQTIPGPYYYYVTQNINNCESPANEVLLSIYNIPTLPVSNDVTACFGDIIPDLTAIGTNVNWYSDSLLTTLIYTGDTFATGETAGGIYLYYVTQSADGCESSADQVTLTINQTAPPIAGDSSVCFGETAVLTASGENILWFTDPLLTDTVYYGNTFLTGDTAVGQHDYYITQTDSMTYCESESVMISLTINTLPATPLASDVTMCSLEEIPGLIATGTNINWYYISSLDSLAYSGDTLPVTDTSGGIHLYYVTLTIYSSPATPVVNDVFVCYGDSIPPFVASGNYTEWYADSALTQLLNTGNIFNSGDTAVGNYYYYVIANDSTTNCVSETDEILLMISNDYPPQPVVYDNTICFGDPLATLSADGVNIRWYSDSTLTDSIYFGNIYNTGQTDSGAYAYYVTQENGCGEGTASLITLTILGLPDAPVGFDTTFCYGVPPVLNSSGTDIQWYSDPQLTNLLFTGAIFTPADTNSGVYTYYLTQTINCESPADTVILTIIALPSAPLANDESICESEYTSGLIASGTDIQWYDTTGLIFIGDTLTLLPTTQGLYYYFATQTVNGCEGPSDTASLTINALPVPPVVQDEFACLGQQVPDLVATGTNVEWYSDSLLTQLIYTGNVFSTGDTAAGDYYYYAIQQDTATGCFSIANEALLMISGDILNPPVVYDNTICYGDTALLTADGVNIHWYSDSLLTDSLFFGNTFYTSQIDTGEYTYYVTQENGCGESEPSAAVLTILGIPAAPVGVDAEYCFGDTNTVLNATGTNINWYSDSQLNNLLYSGSVYQTGETAPGVYIYYITQTITCESTTADTVILTINALPPVPITSDEIICEGEFSDGLIAVGTDIHWYDSTGLIFIGDTLTLLATTPGVHYYYATQTENGCEGSADTVELNIIVLPPPPDAQDEFVCLGQQVPDLVATGINVEWYSDSALTQLVYTGNIFPTGDTAVGEYYYYAIQQGTLTGLCFSNPNEVFLMISSDILNPPVVYDNTICYGDTASLNADGVNIRWYSDSLLTDSLYFGNIFNTSQINTGAYIYYVTQENGCGESEPSVATLTIVTVPDAPVGIDATVCYGDTNTILTASGTNVNWYSDATLSNLLYSGNTYQTGETAPGVYTYYITQTIVCEGAADSVTLTINSLPSAPIALDETICQGEYSEGLIGTGTDIHWYDSTGLIFTGDTLTLLATVPGIHYYFTTQTENGCESQFDTVVFTINASPATPVVTDTAICYGQLTPDLTATGNNVEWYGDGFIPA